MKMLPLMLAAFAFAMPVTAIAADAAKCTGKPVLTAPWLEWAKPFKAKAGHDLSGATAIPIGRANTATLHPIAHVQYGVAPAKAVTPGSFGGTFRLNLAKPSRIGIALSGPAWVDVVTGTKVAATAEHGHGASCSGIRKIVWFDLAKGAHVVQIANAPAKDITIMSTER